MLKLQYFHHLMQRADSLEKTLMLENTEGRKRGDDKGQDGWMASPTLWTWVWASSRRWGRNGEPGVLQSVGSQRLGHNWETEQPFMPSPPKWGKKNCFHLQANYLQFYSSLPPGPPESLKVHADSRKCSIFYKLNFSNLFMKMVWSIPPNMSGGCCCCSVANLCLILLDCSPQGFSVHGISQARILEWTDISSSKGSSWPRDRTRVSCISRQILFHWLTAAAAAGKSLQSCPTLRPHRQPTTSFHHPWDSPGKNTGVGCHFLLQCMKVKSESELAQSCPTLSDPMDCSLLGLIH